MFQQKETHFLVKYAIIFVDVGTESKPPIWKGKHARKEVSCFVRAPTMEFITTPLMSKVPVPMTSEKDREC